MPQHLSFLQFCSLTHGKLLPAACHNLTNYLTRALKGAPTQFSSCQSGTKGWFGSAYPDGSSLDNPARISPPHTGDPRSPQSIA
jgi:hypothetical protein